MPSGVFAAVEAVEASDNAHSAMARDGTAAVVVWDPEFNLFDVWLDLWRQKRKNTLEQGARGTHCDKL